MPADKWAKVPRSLIESNLSNGEFRLYCYLDLIQGSNGRPAKGFAEVGRKIDMKRQTVAEHARSLEKRGLIETTEERSDPPTSGRPAVTMRVVHNPARERDNPSAQVGPPNQRNRGRSIYASPQRTFDGEETGRSTDGFLTHQTDQCGTRNGQRSRSSRSEVGTPEASIEAREFRPETETSDLASRCAHCGGRVVRTPDCDLDDFCDCPF